MKFPLTSLFIFCCPFFILAQDGLDPDKKQADAVLIAVAPKIDGLLDEDVWLNARPISDFVQNQPNPGGTPTQRTEVRILYDNNGIYIGAKMYDTAADSIQKELSERDQLGNTEWFAVVIDAYKDGINGFEFIVSSANVQFDAKLSTSGEDENWDAVWESSASINSEGWVAEIRIPYSAIRFPDKNEQLWHVNFGRKIARNQEKNWWSEIDPEVSGFLNQSGYLAGIKNITSPIRLQANPFIAIYGQQHHDNSSDPVNSYGRSINGGLDVKWGLSDAFTLDMTLIPDFGEAQSDDQVLNLSPFEVRFDENRAFFTEGTELFNKGGLFYSRRIGGTPINSSFEVDDDVEILSNPQSAQLYNATKISGRNNKGLGIGFFNATSAKTYARIKDPEQGEMTVLTNPLTNYNVLVLDQNLPNNSYASLINTTVFRQGSFYDANVTGTEFLLKNKENSYAISGEGALSQLYYGNHTDLGHALDIELKKTSGKLTAEVGYEEKSDTYDINDLGFLRSNNRRSISGSVDYSQYEPFGKFNRGGIGLYAGYNRLYAPDEFTDWGINLWVWAQSKGFWNFNVWGYVSPGTNYDFFEARTDGRVWRKPGSGNGGIWVGSDRRKKLRISTNIGFWSAFEANWGELWGNVNARYRFSDRLNMNVSVYNETRQGRGYVAENDVTFIDSETQLETQRTDIIFGKRDRNTVEAEFSTNYAFSANMTLSFRLRHYWSTVTYNSFHLLTQAGDLGSTSFEGDYNNDYDAFNIDLVYRWRFAPGSDIYIVWKNNLQSDRSEVSPNYFKNTKGLFKEPQDNSISLKVVYFLDYASLIKQK